MFKKSVVFLPGKSLNYLIIGGFPSVIGDGDFPMGRKR
jgi:hypothetical protein